MSEEYVEIEFDLSYETLGRIALIAHRYDITINQAIIQIINDEIDRLGLEK